MTETKRTPVKKAAASKKADSEPEVPVYAFPLDAGHYFSVPVTSRRSTSMSGHVASIRKVVGLSPSTVFTPEVAQAVGQWQSDHDIPVTRVVDESTWDAMFNSEV